MPDFEALFPSLLDRAYGHVDSDVTLFWENDDSSDTFTGSSAAAMLVFIKSAENQVYASLRSTDGALNGICFAFRSRDKANALADKLEPSFAITSKNSVRLIYLIEAHTDGEIFLRDLQESDDDEAYVDDAFPLPYSDYFLPEDYHKGEFETYTLDELEQAFFDSPPPDDDKPKGKKPSKMSSEAVTVERWNDAEVWGKIPKAILDTEIAIARGKNQSEKVWKTSQLAPFGLFLEHYLTRHKVGDKDGEAFVCGSVVDNRRIKGAVKALYMMGIDVDSGESLEKTFHKIRELGLFAVLYTTHSHGTTKIKIKQDRFYQWARKNDIEAEESTESVKAFLTDEGKYRPDVIDSAVYVDTAHEATGLQLIIETRPIDKFRIIFLLDEPYVIADQKKSQRDAIIHWENMILGMAQTIGISIDKAARDPSRLFFYPRHAKGTSSHRILVNAGKPLDWSMIDMPKSSASNEKVTSDPFDQAAAILGGSLKGRMMTPTLGLDIMAWAAQRADGFMISKVFEDHCPDRLRGETASGKFTCECPFDDEHSNAGDADDKGCFIQDAGTESESFMFRCSHDACSGRDRLQMLDKAIRDGWFPDDVLTLEEYDCIDREEVREVTKEDGTVVEEKKHNTSVADFAMLLKKAGELTNQSPAEDVEFILSRVGTLAHYNQTRILKTLGKATGFTAAEVKALMKPYEPKKEEEEVNTDNVGSYDPKKAAIDARNRFLALRRTKKPVVVLNDDEPLKTTKHLITEVNSINIGRPEITKETRDGVEVLPAIDPAHILFRWGSLPVRIERTADDQYDQRTLDKAEIRNIVANHVKLVRLVDNSGFKEDFCPDLMAEQIVTDPDLSPLPLQGFATLPYFNSQRDLVMQPGYNSFSTKILKMKREIGEKVASLPLLQKVPTIEDVDHALNELFGHCFADFPFDDGLDEEDGNGDASRAHFLCMMLHPIVRDLIEGPTPLYLVNKPAAGTGASLLVTSGMTIATGKPPSTKAMPDGEDELRKNVSSAYFNQEPVAFWDNVNTRLDSGIFANIATSAVWSDRVLGRSQVVEIPNRLQAIFAGNNVQASEENMRRFLLIQMDAKRDPTTMKRTFKVANLEAYVAENQLDLYSYLLTMVRYWIAQGAPAWEGQPLTGFEAYCRIMGGILESIEMPGFLGNRHLTSNVDNPERFAWRQFFQEIISKHGLDKFETVAKWAQTYSEMPDQATLFVNGGGRVNPTDDPGKIHSPMSNVLKAQRNQVFKVFYKDEEIEVKVVQQIDRTTGKAGWGLVHVKEEEEAKAA